MEEKQTIYARDCRDFREFNVWEIDEDPNLTFGYGTCPEHLFVIDRDDKCPDNCKFYKEIE